MDRSKMDKPMSRTIACLKCKGFASIIGRTEDFRYIVKCCKCGVYTITAKEEVRARKEYTRRMKELAQRIRQRSSLKYEGKFCCPKCGRDVTELYTLELKELYKRIYLWHKNVEPRLIETQRPSTSEYRIVYKEYVSDLPFPEKATVADIAHVAYHTIKGLMEWSYWIKDEHCYYMHCYAHVIAHRLTSKHYDFPMLRGLAEESPLWRKYPGPYP